MFLNIGNLSLHYRIPLPNALGAFLPLPSRISPRPLHRRIHLFKKLNPSALFQVKRAHIVQLPSDLVNASKHYHVVVVETG